MEDIYVKRSGQTDEPHRHNYFTVLIIKQAKGLHKIDFNSYELAQQQIFFVAPGQVHQVILLHIIDICIGILLEFIVIRVINHMDIL